jgi:myo-inositol-hexaphosphate 3-phosphohydrolase
VATGVSESIRLALAVIWKRTFDFNPASYVVYTCDANNLHLGTFAIGGGSVDDTSSTEGTDVTNFPLGPAFPDGVFIAQDG